jgi:glycosyltransferase involved in cell wall biosynthesis
MTGDKKNLLLIAYYFPPLGMGGVGRALGLYKYLPRHGYDVTVLTVKNIVYPEYDYSLLKNIDCSRIIRSGSLDPSRLLYLWGIRKPERLTAGLRKYSSSIMPDSKRGWNILAFRKAEKIIKNENIAAIITSSPPPSSHLLGLKLKAKYDIPWIADFRDLWFSLPIEQVYHTKEQIGYALELKKRIGEKADEIVSVNNDIKKYLGRGTVIRNGAEAGLREIWKMNRASQSGRFVIGVLGTINYLCPIEPLFTAVAKLIEKDSPLSDKISIVHVGSYNKEMMTELISKYHLENIVSLKGYLPKEKAIGVFAGSSLLYLGVGQFGGYNILPGRIFDYLISGKPIMAVVPPESDAAELVRQSGRGEVFAFDDPAGIGDYIGRQINNKSMPIAVDENELSKYTTAAMAENYAKLITRILG